MFLCLDKKFLIPACLFHLIIMSLGCFIGLYFNQTYIWYQNQVRGLKMNANFIHDDKYLLLISGILGGSTIFPVIIMILLCMTWIPRENKFKARFNSELYHLNYKETSQLPTTPPIKTANKNLKKVTFGSEKLSVDQDDDVDLTEGGYFTNCRKNKLRITDEKVTAFERECVLAAAVDDDDYMVDIVGENLTRIEPMVPDIRRKIFRSYSDEEDVGELTFPKNKKEGWTKHDL